MISKLKRLIDQICMSLLILAAKTLSKIIRVVICIKYVTLRQLLSKFTGAK